MSLAQTVPKNATDRMGLIIFLFLALLLMYLYQSGKWQKIVSDIQATGTNPLGAPSGTAGTATTTGALGGAGLSGLIGGTGVGTAVDAGSGVVPFNPFGAGTSLQSQGSGSGLSTMQQAAANLGLPASWATSPSLWSLLGKESSSTPQNLNTTAQNPTSTAYGAFQFLNGTWGDTGYQKSSDPLTQAQAGLTYIQQRYGSPENALQQWLHHQQTTGNGWY